MRQVILGAFIVSLSLTSLANDRASRREERQDKRIEQGVQSGQLTENEAKALAAQQGRIDKVQDKAAADGNVTKGEKVRIEKMQDRASRQIHRQKHNQRKGG